MKKLFGTDGIRGIAGQPPLDSLTVASTGASLVRYLIERKKGPGVHILIGRDTRESGPWIQEAMLSGIARAGGSADPIGVITTPGLAYLASRGGYDVGVMLSASHNPYRDNGIKIFGPDRIKLSDAAEASLEEEILKEVSELASRRVRSAYETPEWRSVPRERQSGTHLPDPSEDERATSGRLLEQYRTFLLESLARGVSLAGVRLVLDCANGSAAAIAPGLFAALGADIVAIHAAPDGRNINEGCGALHPEVCGRAVVDAKADLGLAFDGDADRCLALDRNGRLLDGDFILYLEALRLHRKGTLGNGAVVGTVMSNLWLEKKLEAEGLRLVRTPVGDKYVLDRMLADGLMLGGEQSGH